MIDAAVRIPFANTYARLPEHFHARVTPRQVSAPRLIKLNTALAKFLGIEIENADEAAAIFSGNVIAEGSEPLAMAYAGHQYANFVPTLGDGRANLLGEVVAQDGKRYDIQLKGSGPTPFSRRGDGRAALGPVLREYILSESMYALGVPTTRALAAVLSGDRVVRETIQPGAVFTRVASSHMRVGTFQYFAARVSAGGDSNDIRTLAEYAMQRHYPEAATAAKPYRALLDGVVARQGALVAQWLLLGFVHGVMNTDNTSISGETIDYGPCAFLEEFHPATVFSSIDRNGRYAYGNQPSIMLWNLSRLAESLLPLLKEEEGSQEAAIGAAHESLSGFATAFHTMHLAGLRRKLGLLTDQDGDAELANDLLERMANNHADFTLTFRRLADVLEQGDHFPVARLFRDPSAFTEWAQRWQARIAVEGGDGTARIESMRRVSPAYVPRNHLVQEVIDAAVLRDDFEPFERLLEVTANPFEERAGLEHYATPARPEERVLETFCGT
jgi:uncharacterized protein YdiU (UPF0061 family)